MTGVVRWRRVRWKEVKKEGGTEKHGARTVRMLFHGGTRRKSDLPLPPVLPPPDRRDRPRPPELRSIVQSGGAE